MMTTSKLDNNEHDNIDHGENSKHRNILQEVNLFSVT